jgi:X-X-X-Leu-X-X-Gly heptad repeat protein
MTTLIQYQAISNRTRAGLVCRARRLFSQVISPQPKATEDSIPVLVNSLKVNHGDKGYATHELGRFVSGSEALAPGRKYAAVPDYAHDPIGNLNSRLHELELDNKKLNDNNKKLNDNNKKLNDNINKLNDNNKKLNDNINKLNDDNKKLNDKINEQGVEIQKLSPLKETSARLIL